MHAVFLPEQQMDSVVYIDEGDAAFFLVSVIGEGIAASAKLPVQFCEGG